MSATSENAQSADLEAVVTAFSQLQELANGDADPLRRGRFLTCDLALGVGSAELALGIERGQVVRLARGPFLLKPWDFAIRAEPETWRRFLEPYPEPGWHDLMALTKVGRARVEGNLVPFMANLQFIKDLLALPRLAKGGTR